MKTVYQTSNNGIYIGETEAQESPLEPGTYLIPKGAVEEEPPSFVPSYQRAKWDGSSWVIQEKPTDDYWYKDTKEKVEFDFGEAPDDTMTDQMPPNDMEVEWDDTIGKWYIPDSVKAERIRNERDRLIGEIYWRVERYRTQIDLGITPDDSDNKMQEIYQYLQDLRDLPQQSTFPDSVTWPTVP